MHEFSIAQQILRIIESERITHGFNEVTLVKMRAGSLSGIDPRALEFTFEVARQESCAAGARLEIDREPMQLQCRKCGHTMPADRGPQNCAQCNCLDLTLQGSTSFEILYLEVNDPNGQNNGEKGRS